MHKVQTATPTMDSSNQLKIRSSIVKAIVCNEKEYVKILTYIVQVMKPDLEYCAEHIEYEIDEGHIRALFGNISDLLDIHQSFFKDLCNETEDDKEQINHQEDAFTAKRCNSSVGGIFVKSKDSFKTYEIYCSNYARAEKVTNDILSMTSLKSTLEKWNSTSHFPKEAIEKSTVLQVYLKQPLYHMCKINVLLKALAVFTSPSQSDLADVITSYSITYSTLMCIEGDKRAKILGESYRIYEDLQTEWDKSGLCNKQGFLTKRGGSVKSWKIRWFTLRSYEMKYFDEPVDEKALSTLDLRQCKRVYETESMMKPNCFALVFDDRTYFMYATNSVEKADWLNLLAWKIYMLQPSVEKARLAMAIPTLEQDLSVADLVKL